MKRLPSLELLMTAVILSLPALILANPIPDFSYCHFSCAAGQQVSVYTLPDGTGDPLSDCYLHGGQKTDATISLWVMMGPDEPVYNFPAEDIWLEPQSGSDGLALCPGGAIADQETDVNGMTTFSQPLKAGGASTGPNDDVVIWIMGYPLIELGTIPMLFNSPDIDKNRVVNLSDVVQFVEHYLGSYDYRCDFYWDGVLNLSDVVLLGQAAGAACP